MRRLPAGIMLLLCAAYVLAGFIGRDPWRDVDMAAFGYMQAVASGEAAWFTPMMAGLAPDDPGLLPIWLGALALKLGGLVAPAAWLDAHAPVLARLPFMALLAFTLAQTWCAAYALARLPGAQPVAFAFGGEASPRDYARALADGALLALLSCLGLAQLGHETSHSLVQLWAFSLAFYALAHMAWQPLRAVLAALSALLALALAGAAHLAPALGLVGVWVALAVVNPRTPHSYSWAGWWMLCVAMAVGVALLLGLWPSDAEAGMVTGRDGGSLARLWLWFLWPVWPLALWTLWCWRAQLRQPRRQPHLFIPLVLLVLVLVLTVFSAQPSRALLLGLPALATLGTLALPTMRRSLGAMVDWLTLIFFTLGALTMWVVWVAVQTGLPRKPAANVARLAPDFVPGFSALPFLIAVLATLAWLALVLWRTRRHRAAIWKSLALPAGGTTLGWVLLMTLWLPMLDHGRSYRAHVDAAVQAVRAQQLKAGVHPPQTASEDASGGGPGCVYTLGMTRAQIAALRLHAGWVVRPVNDPPPTVVQLPVGATVDCPWMLAQPHAWQAFSTACTADHPGSWEVAQRITRPTERRDQWLLLRRTGEFCAVGTSQNGNLS